MGGERRIEALVAMEALHIHRRQGEVGKDEEGKGNPEDLKHGL